ncbi:hypothetical protein [Streptomyces sp. NPDC087297]|uniref:hypothetical protein n=1 Tax=Streptomyces sp. NPDC087297 TaxID=3365778 RepID=UPI0037F31B35
MISINIRSVVATVLLAILAVIGLSGVSANQPADTNWGIAADGAAEPGVTAVSPTPTPPLTQAGDSDWG